MIVANVSGTFMLANIIALTSNDNLTIEQRKLLVFNGIVFDIIYNSAMNQLNQQL